MTEFGNQIVKQVVDIIKNKTDDCTDGSVTQRFCLAILQKMSCKEEVTYQLFEYSFVQWLLGLIERSTKNSDVHVFCVDFGSALLANIFNNSSVLEKLEKSPR